MIEVSNIFRQARDRHSLMLRQLEALCGLKASRICKLESSLRISSDFSLIEQLLEVLQPISLTTRQVFSRTDIELILQQVPPKPTHLNIPAPEFESA